MRLNDYELLYYCHQDNEFSFELLAEKYKKYIYYIINTFKKEYYFFANEDIDLYNEALILLYECIFTYRDDLDVKFSSFFAACLKRKYLHIIRSLANNKNKSHASAISLDRCSSKDNIDLYSIVDNNDLAVSEQVYNGYLIENSLKTMKETLNDLENKIIHCYLYGYSYEEVARQLNLDKKKVDNTIQKYRKMVRIRK